jgi:hypothetical protein
MRQGRASKRARFSGHNGERPVSSCSAQGPLRQRIFAIDMLRRIRDKLKSRSDHVRMVLVARSLGSLEAHVSDT